MTILTGGSSDKPKEAEVLINPETKVKVEFKRPQRDAAVRQQRKVHAAINDLIHSRRRRYLAMNIVVAIASLLVVVTGIFGGMYIYKWVTYSSRVSAQGSCTVRYHEEVPVEGYAMAQMQSATPPKLPRRGHGADETRRRPDSGALIRRPPTQLYPSSQRQYGANGRFVEKYNVLNSNQELLQVPQLGIGPFGMLSITVVHDFNAKLTAILDIWNGRCFVKPLDPTVVPPRDFVDMMRRIDDGTYVPNVCLIRKHYRAQPALDATGLAALRSDIIFRSCSSMVTYKLVRIDEQSTLPAVSTTQKMLIGAGNEDFDRRPDDDSTDDEPAIVLGGETDPDNPRNAFRTRSKRAADDKDSDEATDESVILAGGDADDLVVNVGFGGTDTAELALIHFDQSDDVEAQ